MPKNPCRQHSPYPLTNMVFVKMSHDTQYYHNYRFLQYKEGQLKLVLGDSFYQLNLDVFTKC